ncbi:MAG: glycosyltransferase family 4 protein [Bacteroidetes bacterium]|nr:glycosyltransferase family 4 protein [Bacteroidota bacterium]
MKTPESTPFVLLDVNPLNHRLSGVGKVVQMMQEDLLQDDRIRFQSWFTSTTDCVVPVHDAYQVSLHRRWAYWWLPMVPDQIAITHFTNAMVPFLMPETRLGIKVLTLHDLALVHPDHNWIPEKKSVRWKIERALKQADHFVCVSETTRQDFLDLHPEKEDQSTVISPHPGSDFRRFAESMEIHKNIRLQEKPYFLIVGNQNERKNPLLAIEAWLSLPESYQNEVDLILIGDAGNQSDAIRKTVKSEKIKILGYRSDEETWRWMSGALALLAPARYEGFGLQVQESLWMGTPVLASNIPVFMEQFSGYAELVEQKKEDWVEALKKRIENGRSEEKKLRREINGNAYGDLYLRLLNR